MSIPGPLKALLANDAEFDADGSFESQYEGAVARKCFKRSRYASFSSSWGVSGLERP